MHSGRVNRSNITNLIGLVTMITAKNYAEFQKGYRMCNAGNGPKKTWKEMNEPFTKNLAKKKGLD